MRQSSPFPSIFSRFNALSVNNSHLHTQPWFWHVSLSLRTRRRVPRPPTTFQTLADFSSPKRWQFFSSAFLLSSISTTFSAWHCCFVRSWVIETPGQSWLFFNLFALNKISAFSSWFLSFTISGRGFSNLLPVRKDVLSTDKSKSHKKARGKSGNFVQSKEIEKQSGLAGGLNHPRPDKTAMSCRKGWGDGA